MKRFSKPAVLLGLCILSIGFPCLSFAQTYEGVIPGNWTTEANINGSYLFSTGAAGGSAELQFTIDPVASTFALDSMTFSNITLPQISTSFAAGFGSSNQIVATVKFNPASFEMDPPPSAPGQVNPVPLMPIGGFSQTTYTTTYSSYIVIPNFNLTGSYTLASSLGDSTSGTFTVPISGGLVDIGPLIQPAGYPGSVSLLEGSSIRLNSSSATPTLFSTTLDGTAVNGQFTYATLGANFGSPPVTTTFTEVVPEPSTWALLVRGIGGLVIFRQARRMSLTRQP